MALSPIADVVRTIRVWVRPNGDSCRMRVEGAGNAQWLLQSISSVAFCPGGSSWLIKQGRTLYSHELKCLFPMDCSHVESLLQSLPTVELVMEPR